MPAGGGDVSPVVPPATTSDVAVGADDQEERPTVDGGDVDGRAKGLFKEMIQLDGVYTAIAADADLLREICRFVAS